MSQNDLPPDLHIALGLIIQALDDKKAESIRLLDVRNISTITDFLIIANGNSNPHLKALRGAAEAAIKEAKQAVIGADITQDSGWLVIDAFDIMVHLFTEEMREHYRLEQLWRDAPDINIAPWITETKPV